MKRAMSHFRGRVDELDRRDAQAFLVEVAAVGGEDRAADIGQVGDRPGESDQRGLMKDRRHHDEVGQMPGADPRVVGDHVSPCRHARLGISRKHARSALGSMPTKAGTPIVFSARLLPGCPSARRRSRSTRARLSRCRPAQHGRSLVGDRDQP